MMSIQEDERRRISRDLHDQAGQQIVALKLKLEALERDTNGDMDAPKIEIRERIESAKALIARLDRDIDFFTWELRPPALDQFGLVAALERFAAEWSEIFGMPTDFQEHGLGRNRMRPEIETNLYRIVQEALNNAQKHSGATVVSITLSRLDGEVVLMIEDDGCGFDPEAGGTSGTLGIGLLGMRERTSLMGGLFAVESAPGNGTTVSVRVPASPD